MVGKLDISITCDSNLHVPVISLSERNENLWLLCYLVEISFINIYWRDYLLHLVLFKAPVWKFNFFFHSEGVKYKHSILLFSVNLNFKKSLQCLPFMQVNFFSSVMEFVLYIHQPFLTLQKRQIFFKWGNLKWRCLSRDGCTKPVLSDIFSGLQPTFFLIILSYYYRVFIPFPTALDSTWTRDLVVYFLKCHLRAKLSHHYGKMPTELFSFRQE